MNFQNPTKSFCLTFDTLRVSYYLPLSLCKERKRWNELQIWYRTKLPNFWNSNLSPLLAKKTKDDGDQKLCVSLIKIVRAQCHSCVLGVKWFSGCNEEGDHEVYSICYILRKNKKKKKILDKINVRKIIFFSKELQHSPQYSF